jgi:TonB-dependent receptor
MIRSVLYATSALGRRSALSLVMLGVSAAAAHAGQAGAPGAQPAAGPSQASEVAEIVVTGTRAAQAQALEVKREATTILDAISADDVGKLPDNNAADALQRLPGVTATIDQGEARYVVVRGVDPSLVNVTVNGRIFPGPEGGARRVALDTFPADVISRLEVVKALTPDMDANAVGGTVNIVTPSAFDDPDGFLRASARIGYNQLSGRNTYAGSAAYAGLFGSDEQFGVVLAGSLSYRDYESDNYEANGWALVNGQALPSSRVLRDYQIVRERQGLVANLEWRPSDDFRLYLNNTYARYADDEQRDSTTFEFALGTLSGQTATGGRYSGGRAAVELRDRKVIQTLFNASLGAVYEVGPWTLDGNLTFAQADEDTPKRVDWEFRSGTTFANAYDVSGEYVRIETQTPGLLFDATRYPFRRVRNRTDAVAESTWALSGDARYDFSAWPAYLKAGFMYVTRDKSWDRENEDYGAVTGTPFLLSDVDKPGAADHLGDNFVLGPVIDRDPIRNFFEANRARFTFDAAGSRLNSLVTDFDAEEEVLAGYGMGEFTIAGVAVTAGVRVEHTEGSYESFDIRRTATGVAAPRRTGSTEYTHVLPDVLLRYDAGEDLVLRAAYTNTIGRPNYTDLVPRRDFTVAGTVLTGSEGNPDLDPFESQNFDFSAEYYLGVGGVLSLGLFHKEIENPVYGFTDEQLNVVFEGQPYSRVSIARPENAEKGELTGMEVNYQQTFDFLPGALAGLGLSANYTRVNSQVEVFGRTDDLPFFRQSDELGNVQLFFENERLEMRVAVTYASPYLEAVLRPDFDVYVDERLQVDLRAGYRLNDRVQISADILNLNNSPLRYYVGNESRRAAEERYGPSASLGLNLRF